MKGGNYSIKEMWVTKGIKLLGKISILPPFLPPLRLLFSEANIFQSLKLVSMDFSLNNIL